MVAGNRRVEEHDGAVLSPAAPAGAAVGRGGIEAREAAVGLVIDGHASAAAAGPVGDTGRRPAAGLEDARPGQDARRDPERPAGTGPAGGAGPLAVGADPAVQRQGAGHRQADGPAAGAAPIVRVVVAGAAGTGVRRLKGRPVGPAARTAPVGPRSDTAVTARPGPPCEVPRDAAPRTRPVHVLGRPAGVALGVGRDRRARPDRHVPGRQRHALADPLALDHGVAAGGEAEDGRGTDHDHFAVHVEDGAAGQAERRAALDVQGGGRQVLGRTREGGAADQVDAAEGVRPGNRGGLAAENEVEAVVGRVAVGDVERDRNESGRVGILGLAGGRVAVAVHRLVDGIEDVGADGQRVNVLPHKAGDVDPVPLLAEFGDAERLDGPAGADEQDVGGVERVVTDRPAEDDVEQVKGHCRAARRQDPDHGEGVAHLPGQREGIGEHVLAGLAVGGVSVLVHRVAGQIEDLRPDREGVIAGGVQGLELDDVVRPGAGDAEGRPEVGAAGPRQVGVVRGETGRIHVLREGDPPLVQRRDGNLRHRDALRALRVDGDRQDRVDGLADPRREAGRHVVRSVGEPHVRLEGVRAGRADLQRRVEGAIAVEIDRDRAAAVHGHVEDRLRDEGEIVGGAGAGVALGLEIESDRRRGVDHRERVGHVIRTA